MVPLIAPFVLVWHNRKLAARGMSMIGDRWGRSAVSRPQNGGEGALQHSLSLASCRRLREVHVGVASPSGGADARILAAFPDSWSMWQGSWIGLNALTDSPPPSISGAW